MTSTRLRLLVGLVLALAAARILWPPPVAETEPVARAGERTPTAPMAQSRPKAPTAVQSDLAVGDVEDQPGEAFAVRKPPPSPSPSPQPPRTPAVATVAAPPPPVVTATPAPATPPMQVIGTYDDGGSLGVFVATPSGVVFARSGMVLLSDYRITDVTRSHVALMQESTRRTVELPMPVVTR